ncbi:histidine kinase [Bacteroidia bacterium]|nr:histidine kinase [Bacteroidia bacterium]GHV22785.1 histidine kinase [Bacteroidia bacterium]
MGIYKYNVLKNVPVSLLGALFVIYPNIACLPWELKAIHQSEYSAYFMFFAFRYFFFFAFILFLVHINLTKMTTTTFTGRAIRSFLLTGIAYLLYVVISLLIYKKSDCFGGLLLFQFFVVGVVCIFIGHITSMYVEQRKKEQEIEQLKIQNLQSRCAALTNQINPHFFFNSLNSISALTRKQDKDTQVFINKLSDVFRYILQSEKKGLVTLAEELTFVEAFRYTMEIRFANKLVFNIEVPNEKRNLQLPVLSLLPLIDNIVEHNIIDSQHKMEADIRLNKNCELEISNPIFPKLMPPATNGTGLKNLENRFALLMNKQIRIENDGKTFRVYLPLT